jgi:hypothetical protein
LRDPPIRIQQAVAHVAYLGQVGPERAPRRENVDCLPDGISGGREQQQSQSESEAVVQEGASQSAIPAATRIVL